MQIKVKIDKLVHGGQGMGVLPDGRKVFVWNALPGETVNITVSKNRRDYAEGLAVEVVEASPERVQPLDEAYLSTSPWQIMDFASENKHKKSILAEAFARESVDLPEFEFVAVGDSLHYRNKMEYSFYGDDSGLHLALFNRASSGKRVITGSSIARPEIDETANKILGVLNANNIRASQLKTVMLRCNAKGDVVAAIFAKDPEFPELKELEGLGSGTAVYFSNPKSPASVATKKLYQYGNTSLVDTLLGHKITYDVNSFFQVNLPVFEAALQTIKKAAKGSKNIVDMYSGVGTIGLCVDAKQLVELDEHNVSKANLNAAKDVEIIQASTERALDYIVSDATIIFDPPRAGLHARVTDRVLEVLPEKIIYLSCNPSTQARDLSHLKPAYDIETFVGYNFFPRTPHIESLAILKKRV